MLGQRLTAHDYIVGEVREWIENGSFAPGTLLPPEMELVRKFNVSRGTVRKALKELEDEKLLKAEHGRGRIVAATLRQLSPLSETVLIPVRIKQDPTRFINTGFLKAVEAAIYYELSLSGKNILAVQVDTSQPDIGKILTHSPMGAVLLEEIFYSSAGFEISKRVIMSGTPIVANYDDETLSSVDRVVSDAESGAYKLASFLVRNGCRKILRFWGDRSDRYWFGMRDAGFESAMRMHGLPILPAVRFPEQRTKPGNLSEQAVFEEEARYFSSHLLEHLLSESPPDAIMASTDFDVPVLAAACRLLKKEPGKDIMICGYDSKWGDCPWRKFDSTVPAATINKNNHEIGRRLIATLFDRIAGRLPSAPQLIKVEPSLEICSNRKEKA